VVLSRFAQVLRRDVRADDVPCRYGGEEFAIVLPGADAATAYTVAERIRVAFRAIEWRPNNADEPISITCSLGLTVHPSKPPADNPDNWFDAADHALYDAKDAGRDCVRVFAAPSQHLGLAS